MPVAEPSEALVLKGNGKLLELEWESSFGNTLRLKLQGLADGSVRVLEWRRRKRGGNRFFRFVEEEGRVLPFEHLHLVGEFDDYFDRPRLPRE